MLYEVITMLPSQAFITRIHDMTQQAKSVQILQESEERYRKLVEASTNLVLLFNSTGYVFANPAALKALGYPHFESISEHNPIELFHPDEMEHVITSYSIHYTKLYEESYKATRFFLPPYLPCIL